MPDFGEADALRTELAQSLRREHELREEMECSGHVRAASAPDAATMSLRSAEVDARAARLMAQQEELEESERELVHRAEAAAGEQQRLAELKAELAAQEARHGRSRDARSRRSSASSRSPSGSGPRRRRSSRSGRPRSHSASAPSSARPPTPMPAPQRRAPVSRHARACWRSARLLCASTRARSPTATARLPSASVSS